MHVLDEGRFPFESLQQNSKALAQVHSRSLWSADPRKSFHLSRTVMKHQCSLSIMLPHDPVIDVLRKLKHDTRDDPVKKRAAPSRNKITQNGLRLPEIVLRLPSPSPCPSLVFPFPLPLSMPFTAIIFACAFVTLFPAAFAFAFPFPFHSGLASSAISPSSA